MSGAEMMSCVRRESRVRLCLRVGAVTVARESAHVSGVRVFVERSRSGTVYGFTRDGARRAGE